MNQRQPLESGAWRPCLLLAAVLTVSSLGCSTVPNPYIPSTVGNVGRGDTHFDLQAHIQPASDTVPIGAPVEFRITLRNVGDRTYWVPREPEVRFHFIYSNGRRDNYLKELTRERHFTSSEALALEPGEAMTTRFEVETGYFDRSGITEFFAVVNLARNTNPRLEPFWHGRLETNRYGVEIQKGGSGILPALFGQSKPIHTPSS